MNFERKAAPAQRGELLVAVAADLLARARLARRHGRRTQRAATRARTFASSRTRCAARTPLAAPFRWRRPGGFDVKYGVTSGLTWDFTVNTDFSQVEADEQQVNLSRFNLFFPEKRDFFLENSGIFQFGAVDRHGRRRRRGRRAGRQNAPPDARLFFSRRSACRTRARDSDSGRHAADRASGRLFGGRAEHSAARAGPVRRRRISPRCGCSVTILANSDIGAVLLNKDARRLAYNRVRRRRRELPVRLPEPERLRVKTSSRRSRCDRARATMSPTRPASTTSRACWQSRGRYNAIGERFRDEMGFVPRQGVDNTLLYMRLRLRPEWASKLGMREIRPASGSWTSSPARRQRPRVALHRLAPAF